MYDLLWVYCMRTQTILLNPFYLNKFLCNNRSQTLKQSWLNSKEFKFVAQYKTRKYKISPQWLFSTDNIS